MLCAPKAGVTLAEKRSLTRHLLASGATIKEINAIRTSLSDIKGGRLALACSPASIVTLAISDVVGDEPEVIGSGPTVDASIAPQWLREIAGKYSLQMPDRNALPVEKSSPAESGPFPPTRYEIIARPMDALSAAAAVAEEHGYDAVILGDDIEGEAKTVASMLAAECGRSEYRNRKVALLSGGEVTVSLHAARDGSYGGSNREFALALAMELPASATVAALIADTDGVDGDPGVNGPVAGAFVDSSTLNRGEALGLDARNFLLQHNSGTYFEKLQDEVVTGPTKTNVNDFRMVLIN